MRQKIQGAVIIIPIPPQLPVNLSKRVHAMIERVVDIPALRVLVNAGIAIRVFECDFRAQIVEAKSGAV